MTTLTDRYVPYTTSRADLPAVPDIEFETTRLTHVSSAVSGWDVTGSSGWSWFVPNLSSPDPAPDHMTPKVGDEMVVFGGLGYPIQGMLLNGEIVWYRTPQMREAKRVADMAAWERKKQESFARDRAKFDADYEKLPPAFQRRIDRLRMEDPRFRVDSEGYEMFTLCQAVFIAEHFGTVEKVLAWDRIYSEDNDPPYDIVTYRRLAPAGFALDEHSGNTNACAVRLAVALLHGQDV